MQTDNQVIYIYLGINDTKIKRKNQYNEILRQCSVVLWNSYMAPENERAQLESSNAAQWRVHFHWMYFRKNCFIWQSNPVTYFFLLIFLLIKYLYIIYFFFVLCQWIKFRDTSVLVFETNFHRTLPLISSDFQIFLPAERIRWPLIFFHGIQCVSML